METVPENAASAQARQGLPFVRLAAAVTSLAAVLAVFVAWGGEWGGPPSAWSALQPTYRYVNSGWVAPQGWEDYGPFADEFRAFVIVDQEGLDDFQGGFVSKVNRGSTTSLGRIDFETSVLLAAYYIWRPVQGDPLSVADVDIGGTEAVVRLDLDDDPQGREHSYLYAPMVMVAVERSRFPEGEPVAFTFELEGHPAISLTATPN